MTEVSVSDEHDDDDYDDDYDAPWRPSVLAPPKRSLAQLVGLHLQVERSKRRLSQATFAERIGMSQQQLSKLERGVSRPTTALIERVFAALDLQLRVEVEPLDAGADIEIDRYSGLSDAERADEASSFLALFARLGVLPFVVGGRLGAFLQGAPLRVLAADLVVAEKDLDGYARWIERQVCVRWDEQWRDWGYRSTDPRQPGPMRWRVLTVDLRLDVRPDLPAAIPVKIADIEVRVMPLAEIEAAHPDVERIMRRVRARAVSRARA